MRKIPWRPKKISFVNTLTADTPYTWIINSDMITQSPQQLGPSFCYGVRRVPVKYVRECVNSQGVYNYSSSFELGLKFAVPLSFIICPVSKIRTSSSGSCGSWGSSCGSC